MYPAKVEHGSPENGTLEWEIPNLETMFHVKLGWCILIASHRCKSKLVGFVCKFKKPAKNLQYCLQSLLPIDYLGRWYYIHPPSSQPLSMKIDRPPKWKDPLPPVNFQVLLLMEEIPNNHLECKKKPCKQRDKPPKPQLVTAGFLPSTVSFRAGNFDMACSVWSQRNPSHQCLLGWDFPSGTSIRPTCVFSILYHIRTPLQESPCYLFNCLSDIMIDSWLCMIVQRILCICVYTRTVMYLYVVCYAVLSRMH